MNFEKDEKPSNKPFWKDGLSSFFDNAKPAEAPLIVEKSQMPVKNDEAGFEEVNEPELNTQPVEQSESPKTENTTSLSNFVHVEDFGNAKSSHSLKQDKSSYKQLYDGKKAQAKRRRQILQNQKSRRDDVLDKIRHLENSYEESDAEDIEEDFIYLQTKRRKLTEDSCCCDSSSLKSSKPNNESTKTCQKIDSEPMDVSHQPVSRKPKKKKRLPPTHLMLSEWLCEKPEGFEEEWFGVICPVGKRCMVVTGKCKTYVFSRKNEFMGCFQSFLPGGSSFQSQSSNTRGITILDCIWSDITKVFYVLDVICWKSISCVNCDKLFRQFFLTSKFSESPELLQRCKRNPIPFLPLPGFDSGCLSEVMRNEMPIFKEQVDGVLFYHKESFYYPGVSPLCLWIYLDEIEMLLQAHVSPELVSCQKRHRGRNIQSSQAQSEPADMEV